MSTSLIAEDAPLHRGFLREMLAQCEIGSCRLVEVDTPSPNAGVSYCGRCSGGFSSFI